MNKEDEDRQIRETRSLLQKAGQRNAPMDARRDALRRLIGLTHMPSRELKVFAAQHFNQYFKDFPDLEEDVIDSVYDICEDSDAQVRIEGYKTIVALSREAKKWTRRNTDVLVQLLQSDEPVELKQIEESLIAHVHLDPAAAIGVLCDHCSLDPDLSAEDKEDREKLRKLVLLFLANKAKEHIFTEFGGKDGGGAELVFREGLLKAIGAADVQDTELIVKELLLSLDSYTPRSDQGDELLRTLLDRVRMEYTQLRSKPGTISLAPIQAYLALLDYVVIVKKVADPAPLLRFYSMTLIGKMALQKLDPPSQIDIIQRLADILAVCEEERRKQPQDAISQDLISLRNMVVDACPHLVERLIRSHNNDRKQWKASLALLQACCQRQDDGKWTPPTNLIPALNQLSILAERAPPGVDEFTNQVKTLIQGLHVEPSRLALPTRQPERNGSKRKFDNEGVSTAASPRTNLPLSNSILQEPGAPGSSQTVESGPRGTKLINRLGGDVSLGERAPIIKAAETPTLLRRMSSSDGRVSNGASTDGRPQPSASSAVPASVSMALPMLSIKGAASKLLAKEDTPQQVPALIDRMQTDDLSREGQGNAKKKRRHKTGG